MAVPNCHHECNGVQRNTTLFTYGLLSHDNKPRNMHNEEGPPPLYISYVSPGQTKQDRHQETLEAKVDNGIYIWTC